jgi:hypothetical protein
VSEDDTVIAGSPGDICLDFPGKMLFSLSLILGRGGTVEVIILQMMDDQF